MSVVEELEYVRLYDMGDYWCIEDKLLARYPVVSRSKTSTIYEMWFDIVMLPDGVGHIARAYYPKSIPLRIIRQTLHTWNEKWKKMIAEIQPLLEAQATTQTQAAQSGEVEEGLDESLKRLREYLKYLR